MTDSQDQINALSERLQQLLHRQDEFSKEINALRRDIHLLRTANDGIDRRALGLGSKIEENLMKLDFVMY